MKRLIRSVSIMLALVVIFTLSIIPAQASVTQTETTKELDANNGTLIAYAAFDRFGSHMSNGMEWDYTGRASIKNSPNSGTLKLTIKGQASLRKSASISIGVGVDSVSASVSSSWEIVSSTYSQTKSVTKKSAEQSTSDTSNLIVAPREDYNNNTACITVTASIKYSNSSKTYKINALA